MQMAGAPGMSMYSRDEMMQQMQAYEDYEEGDEGECLPPFLAGFLGLPGPFAPTSTCKCSRH